MLIFFAVLSGINIVVSRFLNAGYAERNSNNMSTLLNYVTGLLTALVVLLISAETTGLRAGGPSPLNPWIYLGGLLGVVNWLLANYLTPRIPAFVFTLLVFISQLLTGLLLDYLLLGNFSMGKLTGGLLVLLGLAHYQRVNQKAAAKSPPAS